jgi:hypothetical protein
MKKNLKSKLRTFRANFYGGNNRRSGVIVGTKIIIAEDIDQAIYQEVYHVNGFRIQSKVNIISKENIDQNICHVVYSYPETKLQHVTFHTDFFEETSQP